MTAQKVNGTVLLVQSHVVMMATNWSITLYFDKIKIDFVRMVMIMVVEISLIHTFNLNISFLLLPEHQYTNYFYYASGAANIVCYNMKLLFLLHSY